jgi:hypothetical protein
LAATALKPQQSGRPKPAEDVQNGTTATET